MEIEEDLPSSETLAVLILKLLCNYNSAVLLMNMTWMNKTQAHTQTHTRIFIAALFVIGSNWEQSRCSSTGEWLNCGHPYHGILSNEKE